MLASAAISIATAASVPASTPCRNSLARWCCRRFTRVSRFHCQQSVGELSAALRQIEHDNGRRRTGPKFSSRAMDIDILTYDQCVGAIDGVELPRGEITENAFVLQPLADIAGSELHPLLARSYSALWQDYDQSSQQLWPVEFRWRGADLPMSSDSLP
jgi:2-amino-4-hydroxy-6-hydroxymethyldihydropteridine diphosphokinase